MRMQLALAGAAAAAVLWTADRFGLLSAPYTSAALDLRGDDSQRSNEPPGFTPAPRSRVDEHSEVIAEFMRRVLDLDARQYFLSDDSTVLDFVQGDEPSRFTERTRQVYGVDVADIDPPNLWEIARRIEERRKPEAGRPKPF
ncbi:MAG TPA: hypothetical protein VFD69_06505 [Vicinamibacterales bacterium]|nr:hypothetical protein [Vicinamibacterales bacterium]